MTYTEAHTKTRELLDEGFLNKLVELARLYGWSGDYIEIDYFIRELYGYTELPLPDLTPYELDED